MKTGVMVIILMNGGIMGIMAGIMITTGTTGITGITGITRITGITGITGTT
jgi:hypothetical protein